MIRTGRSALHAPCWYRLRAMRLMARPVRPHLRVAEAPRSMRDRAAEKELRPELLLSKGELREARRLLSLVERARQPDDEMSDAGPQAEAAARLECIARAALLREAGVERFMVVRIRRDDGYTIACRLESLTLAPGYFASAEFQWSVRGAAMRKDQTIGLVDAGMNFSFAHISRRCLSGRWAATKLGRRARSINAFRSR